MSSVFTYILSHPDPTFLDDLYGRDTTQRAADQALSCKTVFQSLATLTKNYVIRLLFLSSTPFKIHELVDWVKPGHLDEHLSSVQELIRYRIILPLSGDSTR